MDTDPLKETIATYEACTDQLEKARLAFQIARYYHLNLNNYTESLKYFLQALHKAEEIPDEREISIICNGLGALYRNVNDFNKSEETLLRAISIAESLHDESLLTRPYINLGNVYMGQFKLNEALECYLKALRLAEKFNDRELTGLSLINAGNVYITTRQNEKALQYLRQSLKSLDSTQRVRSYSSLANLYYVLHDYQLAIGYSKKAISAMEKIHDHTGIIMQYYTLIISLLEINKVNKAIEYGLKAKKYIEDNQVNSKETKPVIYNIYIMVYNAQGDTSQVKLYIKKFLKLKVTSPSHLLPFYHGAIKYFKKQRKYKLALEYTNIFTQLSNEVREEELRQNIAIKTANFEYEQEKQKAELLKLKNDELEQYQKIIEQKNNDLILLHEEKDNLMNTISHDLKNYLGATQQAIDILAVKDPAFVDSKYMKIVATSNNRSLNLVKEILYSTKATASKDSLSLQTVDINQIIANEEDTLRLRGNKKGLNIIFEYAPEPLYVQIDNEKWHRVFENLTTNAIKFTPAEHDIRISTQKVDNHAYISIKDSGIGIAPENIPKLFTPFSGVGRKGTEGEESTGLGLSIVKKLVELHGGEIEVFSEVGKGTEFVVKLRIAL